MLICDMHRLLVLYLLVMLQHLAWRFNDVWQLALVWPIQFGHLAPSWNWIVTAFLQLD